MSRKSLLAVLVPALISIMATDAAAARPDLEVRSLAATQQGGTVRVTTALRGPRTDVAYLLSSDRRADRRDRVLARTRAKGRQRVTLTLPAGIAPGSYRLIACADARRKVRERNERNNCRVAAKPIVVTGGTVPSPPPPGPGPGPDPTPAPPKDTTAPETTITAGPDGTSASRSASFAFRASESARFECRLDGAAFAPCDSPEDYRDLEDGGHHFAVRAIDRAGNVDPTPATRAWTVDAGEGPQGGPKDPPARDPVAEADPLPATGTTTLADATAFLYTGANPIQKNVEPDAIAEQRVAVLRGRVLNRMGVPIAGVRISVLDHPELGHTATRADGGFDLAVNGGGNLVLRYERAGWMPVQRTVDVPWQDYTSVEDVVMAPYDDAVTPIDLGSGEDVQVHRASPVADGDGRRQAVLMFAEGTEAEMVMPDGSKVPLEQLDVRATEYTIGESGRAAMPGALPVASGYTYAVELSVDQAVEAGATEVRFSKPVVNYVDNFLGFPVGGVVPSGYYDREAGRWVPIEDGRVIAIVGETGGLAEVDTDGDGTADSGLGITDAERERLASLYDPGKSLWRVAVRHFTPYDHNWPYAPPLDSVPPRVPVPNQNRPKPKKECWVPGSIIGCEGQRLGQTLPVTGTPFDLRYWSDRTPGYEEESGLSIPLVGATVPSGLQRVYFEVEVAGQTHKRAYAPKANLMHDFQWDGKDAYGRTVKGAQPVTVRIGYQYGLVQYSNPILWGYAFARVSGSGIAIDGASRRMDAVIWREYRDETQTTVGGFDARDQALGGWTLDAHHWFDARNHTVHLGDGGRLNADPVITTAAGNGRVPVIPRQSDGQLGTNVPLGGLGEIEVGPDGTVYFTETVKRFDGTLVGNVRRIDADGHVRTLATNLGATIGIGVADDGSVYVAESIQHRVKRIAPNGMVFPFAGGGTGRAEGAAATAVRLSFPSDVAVAPDGGIYIAENMVGGVGTIDHGIVSHVGPDGRYSTVAGGGAELGDGGPATQAKLSSASGLAVGPDGLLVIATRDRIRKLDAGGRISTIAGGGNPETGNGDGGPATEARITGALAVDVMADGGVLFVDGGLARHVAPDGMLHRVAGGGGCGAGSTCDIGDRGPAPQAALPGATGVAVAPDGAFYVTTAGDELDSGRIRRVARPLVRQHGGRGVVPSADGTEAYEFDLSGRHLRTLDGLTGAVRLSFGYDDAGRLATITDADGNVTAIEREGDGRAKAIVAPGGQKTGLTVGAAGWLERVENPAGEATRLEYRADGKGLLEKLIDRRGKAHEYTYSGAGRLATDKDPELGVQQLDVERMGSGYVVRRVSALGRTQSFSVQKLPGVLVSETTTATGARTRVESRSDGKQVVIYPDGTKVEVHREPDPQWGFNAPMVSSYKVTTPEGRVDETTITRTTTLADSRDPLSVVSMTEQHRTGNRITKVVYDAEARTITTTTPKGRTTTTTLDEDANVARVERPGQDAIVITRDDRGRLERVEQGLQRWTYEYDAKGRVKARTDAADKRIEYGYDDADRLTSVKRPSGRTYGFAYDAAGMPKTVTMPDGDVHELGHNAIDQLERFQPAGSPAAQTRRYDRDHGLEKITLPGGRVIEHGRATQTGRPTGQGYPEAEVLYGFDDATDRQTSMTWNPTAAGPDEKLEFGWDGQMPKSVTASGTAAGRYDYTYGAGALLSNIKLTSGTTTLDTALVRDDDGLVTGLGPFTLTRTNHDSALKIAEGAFNADMTFDGHRRLATRSVKIGTGERYRAELTRNVRGQVERKVETIGGATADYRYDYDGDGRLLTVKKDGVLVEEYGYDANGNRRTRAVGGGAAEPLTYDGQERLATRGSVAYGFDADGFLATRGDDRFTYSARGELLRAEVGGDVVTYAYDAWGRRVSRTQGTATEQYLYGNPADPFQVTAVRDAAGVLTAYYYDEAGHLFALRRGTTRFYVATDQVGTPRVVTQQNGTVVKTLTYDAFGVLAGETGTFDLPFGFAGGLADRLTGLVRFGLRDYEPAAGRWTARDPALFGGGQANLYDYVGGDPIDRRDPSGLICIGGSVYAGFGGGGQFCINDEGFSLCAEAGFGVGTDAGIDLGDLAEDGETIVAEIEGQLGPIKAKVGVELDNSGCLSVATPEAKLVTGGPAVKLNQDGDVSFSYEPDVEVSGGPDSLIKSAKVKVAAKVAAKFCRRALW